MDWIDQLIEFLRSMGPAGLFGMAFLDSAGLPTGGGPDIVLVLAMQAQPLDLLVLVPVSVIGSVLGCIVLYLFGLKGGDKALARIGEERRASIKGKIDRHGFATVLLAMLGPPPYPTKLFVFSAGVFKMRLAPFLVSVVLGRTLRYAIVAYLAMRFGEQATEQLREHYPPFFLSVVCALVLAFLVRRRWQQTRSKK
jgi:membrane protein YqaA with SNARE-associated domain